MTAHLRSGRPSQSLSSTSRRAVLLGLSAALATAKFSMAAAAGDAVSEKLALLEREIDGRIGLAACSGASGSRIDYRADERFAMCSTFKLMLAAAVLARVDAGQLHLGQRIRYTRDSLLANSPVTTAHVNEGALSLEEMAQAIVEVSDNTAANELLMLIGGPPGYTRYLRALGDRVTRLDRVELALNSNLPGDVRDTTTPRAMLADINRVLLGSALSTASRGRLLRWLRDCRTGRERLRAQLPQGWSAGDKTGTGDRGANNDLAIFWPPAGAPLLLACYISDSQQPTAGLNAAHARIGAAVADVLP